MAVLLVMILYVSSKVLRPPSGNTTGFLLWHIIAVSIGMAMVVTTSAYATFARLGLPAVIWQLPVFLIGMGFIDAALVIIFRVELRRMQRKRNRT